MFPIIDSKIAEPITIDGLKEFLSVRDDVRADDPFLTQIITAARTRLEEHLERVIVARNFELAFTSGGTHALYPSLIDVESITYFDNSGHEHYIEDYFIIKSEYVAFDTPGDLGIGETIKVVFRSGYESCPATLMLAIEMMCKELYARSAADPLTDEIRKIVQSEVIYDL